MSPDAVLRYPDDEYTLIKQAIAEHHHCSPDNITVGNGSAEILRTLCHTILSPGKTVYVAPHTFSEYEHSSRLAGAGLAGHEEDAVISFVCNPENPSGILTPKETIIAKIPKNSDGTNILCVDEAFIDLADPGESVSDIQNPGLFVVRSLTKSFAIPGIRFGYGIGEPALVAAMEAMRPPWTVNVLAESIVLQAFSRYHELGFSREMIKKERKHLYNAIISHGWRCIEGSANYLLIDTGQDARELTSRFLDHNILVRDCTSFDLPECIRIAVRTTEENNRLIEVMETLPSCTH
ncbi:MAG: histidinol-phosphate aminotransferase family protein [Methanoregula sp.]|nr:histidinol-phosphate aminotransferase family protein [Methanoregula sp.]